MNYETPLMLFVLSTSSLFIAIWFYGNWQRAREERFMKQFRILKNWIHFSPVTGNNREFIGRLLGEIKKLPESNEPEQKEMLLTIEEEYKAKFNQITVA